MLWISFVLVLGLAQFQGYNAGLCSPVSVLGIWASNQDGQYHYQGEGDIYPIMGASTSFRRDLAIVLVHFSLLIRAQT